MNFNNNLLHFLIFITFFQVSVAQSTDDSNKLANVNASSAKTTDVLKSTYKKSSKKKSKSKKSSSKKQFIKTGSISSQFDFLVDNSKDYKSFKMAPKKWISILKLNVIDSLSILNNQFVASNALQETQAAKICAMGVRVSRWVSMHGLALNVKTNLNHFDLIVPCGLTDRKVTSMHQQLGDNCPTMDQVKQFLTTNFRKAIASNNTECE